MRNTVYVEFKSGAQTGVYTISVTSKEGDTSFPVRVSNSDTVVADKSNVTINVAQGTGDILVDNEKAPSITLVDPTTGKAPLASAFTVTGGAEGTDWVYDRVTGVLTFKQPAWVQSKSDVVYTVKDKATTPNTVATVTIKYGAATTDPFENATVADAYVGDTVVVISGVTSGFAPAKSDLSVTVGSTKVDISSVDNSDAANGNLTIYLDDPLPAGQLVVESSSVANYADSQTEAVDVALRTENEIAIEDPVTAGIAEGKDEAVSTQAGAIYKVCKDLTVAKTTVNDDGSVTIKFDGKVDLSAAGKGADEAWPAEYSVNEIRTYLENKHYEKEVRAIVYPNVSHLTGMMSNRELEKKLYRMVPVIGFLYRSFGKYKKRMYEGRFVPATTP